MMRIVYYQLMRVVVNELYEKAHVRFLDVMEQLISFSC